MDHSTAAVSGGNYHTLCIAFYRHQACLWQRRDSDDLRPARRRFVRSQVARCEARAAWHQAHVNDAVPADVAKLAAGVAKALRRGDRALAEQRLLAAGLLMKHFLEGTAK